MSNFVVIEVSEGESMWINIEAITRLELSKDGGTRIYLSDGREPIETMDDVTDVLGLNLTPTQDAD